jgi:hypothetical protein
MMRPSVMLFGVRLGFIVEHLDVGDCLADFMKVE